MLFKKADGVSCCDVAAELGTQLPVTKKTGTCHAEHKPTARLVPSPCQLLRRTSFRFLTSLWNSLSTAQKDSWDTLASSTPFVNDCGEVYFISPFNMFSKVNGVLLSFGVSFLLSTAPVAYTPPASMLAYTTSYVDIPQSAYRPLVFDFTVEADRGFQILSYRKPAVPQPLKDSYFRLLSSQTSSRFFYGDLTPSSGALFSSVIDSTNTFLYCVMGGTPYTVKKFRLSDMTQVATLNLSNPTGQARLIVIDSTDSFLYVGLNTSPGTVDKIRLSDFVNISTLTFNVTENQIRGIAIDHSDTYLYCGLSTSPGLIIRVQLSDFTRNASLSIATPIVYITALILDSTDTYLYTAGFTNPCHVAKIRVSDFSFVTSVSFPSGKRYGESIAIDSNDTSLYVGLTISPGEVHKVRLSDFVYQGSVNLSLTSRYVRDLAMSPDDLYLYVACSWSGYPVVVIQLSDFSLAEYIYFIPTDIFCYTLSIDSSGAYLYALFGSPATHVTRIDLSYKATPDGILHCWFHGYNKTKGRCLINPDTDYSGSLIYGARLPDGSFLVRTVNFLTGAFIDEIIERSAIE